MSEKKAPGKPAQAEGTRKSAKSGNAIESDETREGFTDEERAAMKERGDELKAASKRGSRADKADGESDVLAKIAEMAEPDRMLGLRLHDIIKASAPVLSPKLWYGMPAYARDGKVVCFFQSSKKFNTRYATLGFSDSANLDDGEMWPAAFALKELTAAAEAMIIGSREKSGQLTRVTNPPTWDGRSTDDHAASTSRVLSRSLARGGGDRVPSPAQVVSAQANPALLVRGDLALGHDLAR